MTREELIKEILTIADNGYSSLDAGMPYDTRMDDAVLTCARNALRWLLNNAPLDMLDGGEGIIVSLSSTNGNFIVTDNFVRLRYVKGTGWSKALSDKDMLREDSDGYMMHTYDPDMATADHPYVVMRYGLTRTINAYPSAGVTCYAVVVPDMTWATDVPIPERLHNALVYYAAYLLALSHGDNKAKSLMAVVQDELKLQVKQQQ